MNKDTLAGSSKIMLTSSVNNATASISFAKPRSNLFARGFNALKKLEQSDFEASSLKKKGIAAYDNGNHELALSILSEIAVGDDAEAQMYVGFLHYHSGDEQCNIELALEYLTKSADQGWVEAQSTLGYLYSTELHELNQAKILAFNWLFKAAIQGDEHSYYFLGLCYLEGNGTQCNPELAFEWFLKAEPNDKRGHVQMDLSNLFFIGKGVPEDWESGLKWLIKSAELGKAEAMYALGRRYAYADRVPDDIQLGHDWLLKAAAKDHSGAINLLNSLNYRELYEKHAHLKLSDMWF